MYHLTRFIPAELVETDAHGECFTTSLKVAEHFGRNHKHVLDSIRQLIGQYQRLTLKELYELAALCNGRFDVTGRPNFRPTSYTDEWNRTQMMYRISRDGFMLLTMGFTGQKAFVVKQRFLVAFNEMEARLHARESHEAQAFYQLREPWRQVVDGTLQGKSRAEIAEAAGYTSPESVSGARRRLRDLGVLTQGGQA